MFLDLIFRPCLPLLQGFGEHVSVAGGDLDGEHVQISLNAKLVALVRANLGVLVWSCLQAIPCNFLSPFVSVLPWPCHSVYSTRLRLRAVLPLGHPGQFTHPVGFFVLLKVPWLRGTREYFLEFGLSHIENRLY